MKNIKGYDVIRHKAIEILKKNPDGLRFSELLDKVKKELPNFNENTIWSEISSIANNCGKNIYKPTRGLYKYIEDGFIPDDEEKEIIKKSKYEEKDFYIPIAKYLQSVLAVCTEAIPYGGNNLGNKWGTPDVIGVYKPLKSDIIKFEPEIITAEVKINPSANEAIIGFGQAIAYRLFSTKVFLFEPKTLKDEDSDRLESLCLLFGIGFIKFDADNIDNPNWEIIVSAQRFSPDNYYVNDLATKLLKKDKDKFNKLFQ